MHDFETFLNFNSICSCHVYSHQGSLSKVAALVGQSRNGSRDKVIDRRRVAGAFAGSRMASLVLRASQTPVSLFFLVKLKINFPMIYDIFFIY